MISQMEKEIIIKTKDLIMQREPELILSEKDLKIS